VLILHAHEGAWFVALLQVLILKVFGKAPSGFA
jgi:hypothetical protein